MEELALECGCNPNQKPLRIFMEGNRELPITVLSGRPDCINFVDALGGWQLVKELGTAAGFPAAAFFRHVSPAGAVVSLSLDETLRKIYWVNDMDELSPLASAYTRTRGADRMSSFGGLISLSDVCDADTARIIKREVPDGVVAPGYESEAPETLKSKKDGSYNVIQTDSDYEPEALERKQVLGITFKQGHNNLEINRDLLEDIVMRNRELPDSAKIDLMIFFITLEYTQSNSTCYVRGGQAIGIGVGQQSRVHYTRLIGSEMDSWCLRQAPQVMNLPSVDSIKRVGRDNTIDVYMGDDYMNALADGKWEKTFRIKPPVFTAEEKKAWLDVMTDVTLGSDAFFPFGDSTDRASKSGTEYVARPGGSVRDDQATETCNQYGMVVAFTGIRLLHRQWIYHVKGLCLGQILQEEKPRMLLFADLQYFVNTFLRGPSICALCFRFVLPLYFRLPLWQTRGIVIHELSLEGRKVS